MAFPSVATVGTNTTCEYWARRGPSQSESALAVPTSTGSGLVDRQLASTVGSPTPASWSV